VTQAQSAQDWFEAEEQRIELALDLDSYDANSIYNVPGYKPVSSELTCAPVRVSGRLPADLEGVYLRNGTNVQFDPTHVRIHAFVGAGMIHGVEIKDGTATYSNAYVRTPRFEAERAAGREVFVEFSDIAGAGPIALDKMKLVEAKRAAGIVPDLAPLEQTPGSTSIRYHHERLYCLQEGGYAFVLDTRIDEEGRLVIDGRGRLETWDGEWEGPFSAHPRVSPGNGDVYNLSVSPDGRIIAGLISQGELQSQATVHLQSADTGQMGWLHDFFLTENYLVFPDISVRRDFAALQAEGGSVFSFDEQYSLRWGVVARDFRAEAQVRWFATDQASTVWHVINAWERPSADGTPEIVLYAPSFPTYPSSVPIHTPEEPPAQVKTWVLNLTSGKVEDDRVLLEHGYERPSLNLGYVGAPSRFCYLLDEHGDGYMGKGVLKYDLIEEREAGYLSYGDMYGGEALFVSRAGPATEDDGYLLDLLMTDDRADLIVIDARTMTELARLHLPQRVPFDVHACWLGPEELTQLNALTPNHQHAPS
jgi:carotenoid cleavage dioxygenase-like enzyme